MGGRSGGKGGGGRKLNNRWLAASFILKIRKIIKLLPKLAFSKDGS